MSPWYRASGTASPRGHVNFTHLLIKGAGDPPLTLYRPLCAWPIVSFQLYLDLCVCVCVCQCVSVYGLYFHFLLVFIFSCARNERAPASDERHLGTQPLIGVRFLFKIRTRAEEIHWLDCYLQLERKMFRGGQVLLIRQRCKISENLSYKIYVIIESSLKNYFIKHLNNWNKYFSIYLTKRAKMMNCSYVATLSDSTEIRTQIDEIHVFLTCNR